MSKRDNILGATVVTGYLVTHPAGALSGDTPCRVVELVKGKSYRRGTDRVRLERADGAPGTWWVDAGDVIRVG